MTVHNSEFQSRNGFICEYLIVNLCVYLEKQSTL